MTERRRRPCAEVPRLLPSEEIDPTDTFTPTGPIGIPTTVYEVGAHEAGEGKRGLDGFLFGLPECAFARLAANIVLLGLYQAAEKLQVARRMT